MKSAKNISTLQPFTMKILTELESKTSFSWFLAHISLCYNLVFSIMINFLINKYSQTRNFNIILLVLKSGHIKEEKKRKFSSTEFENVLIILLEKTYWSSTYETCLYSLKINHPNKHDNLYVLKKSLIRKISLNSSAIRKFLWNEIMK